MILDQRKIHFIYIAAIFFCLLPFVSPAIALLIGLLFSIIGLKSKMATQYTSLTLQASIVLMGFGMNLLQVVDASRSGFFSTALSVVFVMGAGMIIGRLLKIDSKTAILVSSGTAICGGSAIAAVSPVIDAKTHQISFALIVVFALNALALIIFPYIGYYFHLSQEAFGYWAAIAIHDTSSVVGAGATYGTEALEIATTVKLVRTLWIIPLSAFLALMQKNNEDRTMKIPWFIGLFIISIVITYLLPQWQSTFVHLNWLGKKGMTIAIFLIGSGISFSEAKKAGLKSFILGITLWILIGVTSFMVITY